MAPFLTPAWVSKNSIYSTMFLPFFSLCLSWLLWRFWRFVILPAFRPNDPKELPFLVPSKSSQLVDLSVNHLLTYLFSYWYTLRFINQGESRRPY